MKRAYSNAVLEYGKGSSEAKELEGRISQLSGELRENQERMKDAGDVAEDFGDSLEDASNGADKLDSGLSVATVAMGNLISSGINSPWIWTASPNPERSRSGRQMEFIPPKAF